MKAKKHTNLDDRFFKKFYSDPEFAVELFKPALSKQQFSACDWNTLKADKDSLKDKRADLVCNVSFKKKYKIKALLCLLLVHRSSYEQKIFRQFLSYQAALYKMALDKRKPEILVLPILFYTGKTPWKWPVTFQEGFFGKHLQKIPPTLRKNMVDFKLKIVDTNDPKVKKAFKDLRTKS